MSTEKFTPRPHQVAAIKNIIGELTINDRATAIMACGSGKTLVALWVAEMLCVESVLVLLPSLALIAQVFKEWKNHTNWKDLNSLLCVCSDETVTNDDLLADPDDLPFPVTTNVAFIKASLYKTSRKLVVFSTYQSCHLIPNDFTFDLGIFDEAHKTAGNGNKQFAYALDNKNINISKRLFMTATPRHLDVNKGKNVFSMNNQSLYGKVCHKLSFSDAVKQGIICGYKIIISILTAEDVNRLQINTSNINLKKRLIDAKNIAFSLSLANAIKESNIKKIFTFHKNVKDAQLFAIDSNKALRSSLNNFKAIHINGGMNSVERRAILDDFKESQLALLSNARCLTEGVDVPSVDMVAFMSPKKSQIDIIQAAGRAMRKYEGKQEGYIFIPVFLEDYKQESLEMALNDTKYNELWNILQALQEYDEELFTIISDIQKRSVRKESPNYKELDKKIKFLSIGSSLQLTTLRNAITTKIIDRLTNTWDENFEKLVMFKEKYGHTCPYPHDKRHKSLGQWVKEQRQSLRLKLLSKQRIDKLNSIGFTWKPFKDNWEKKFQELLEFKNKHGHVNVPTTRHKQDKLAAWVLIQRRCFKEKAIDKERINKLNAVNFLWRPKEDRWEEKFQELLEFKDKYGHVNVPGKKIFRKLSTWTIHQRGYFKKNELPQDRIDKLNSVGFIWYLSETSWDEKYKRLLAFKEEHGHINLNTSDRSNGSLRRWICRLRTGYKENTLSQEKIDKLNAIGFCWNIYKSKKQSD